MKELKNQARLKQIIKLRQEGLTQEEVADELGICVSTLRYYLFPHVRMKATKSTAIWMKNNPEKMKEANKKWKKNNPNWEKDYYKKHPDKLKRKRAREKDLLKEKFRNMTPEERDEFRKKRNEYDRKRYHTDEKVRNNQLSATREWQKRTNYYMNRYHSDPEFKSRVILSITKYQKRMRAEGNVNFLTRQRNHTKKCLRRMRFREKFERIGYKQSDILAAQKIINFDHKDYNLSLINHLANIPTKLIKNKI